MSLSQLKRRHYKIYWTYSSNIDMTIENRTFNFTVSPNSAFVFDEEAVIVKDVPFDYPYKNLISFEII